MSEWIKHDGKSRPVDSEVMVYVKFGDGVTDEQCIDGTYSPPSTAGEWGDDDEYSNWIWSEPSANSVEIVEYRVVRLS